MPSTSPRHAGACRPGDDQRADRRHLFLTPATVRHLLRGAYRKLGAVSRVDAVNRAAAAGLLEPTQTHEPPDTTPRTDVGNRANAQQPELVRTARASHLSSESAKVTPGRGRSAYRRTGNTDFGALLTRSRLTADLSRTELANMTGVGLQTIRKIENGQRPHLSTAVLLADALGLTGEQRAAFLAAARPGGEPVRSPQR
jgi:DNA-binding XRE family transcriptional regulator